MYELLGLVVIFSIATLSLRRSELFVHVRLFGIFKEIEVSEATGSHVLVRFCRYARIRLLHDRAVLQVLQANTLGLQILEARSTPLCATVLLAQIQVYHVFIDG